MRLPGAWDSGGRSRNQLRWTDKRDIHEGETTGGGHGDTGPEDDRKVTENAQALTHKTGRVTEPVHRRKDLKGSTYFQIKGDFSLGRLAFLSVGQPRRQGFPAAGHLLL